MPIEFRCTQCGKLLRTPEGTSGKKAKCPQCGTVLVIPELQASPADDLDDIGSVPPPPPQSYPPAGANPYPAPPPMASASPSQAPGLHPARIEFGETLDKTWQLYKANLGTVISGAMLAAVASFVIIFAVVLVLQLALSVVVGNNSLTKMLLNVAALSITAFFMIGLMKFMLCVARGQQANYSDLFSGGPQFLFGAAIVMISSFATTIGFVLLIVPGIYIFLTLSQSMYMLVDQGTDIVGSLKSSHQVMEGNKLTLLGIWIVAGTLGSLLSMLTCGIGLIFFIPFTSLLMAVVYLGVTGQRTVLDP